MFSRLMSVLFLICGLKFRVFFFLLLLLILTSANDFYLDAIYFRDETREKIYDLISV